MAGPAHYLNWGLFFPLELRTSPLTLVIDYQTCARTIPGSDLPRTLACASPLLGSLPVPGVRSPALAFRKDWSNPMMPATPRRSPGSMTAQHPAAAGVRWRQSPEAALLAGENRADSFGPGGGKYLLEALQRRFLRGVPRRS